MDWIEQWFGFSPDNGDGTFELFLMLLAVVVVAGIVIAVNRRARNAFVRLAGVIVPRSTHKH